MKLLSDRMCEKLEELMGFCFIGNRIADRAQSVLKVDYVMPRTGDILHLHYAHEMPLLADVIADYCDDRNYAVNYPLTPKDYTRYSNIKEIFDKILEYSIDLEKLAIQTIELAVEEKDTTTAKFLDNFLRSLIPYTKMALAFVDYVSQNGYTPKDNMLMDLSINHYMGIEAEHKTDD